MSPAWDRAQDAVRDTLQIGEKYSRRALRREGLSMSRKDLRALRKKLEVSAALAVYGKAVVTVDGVQTERSVRLWDTLPPWWNRGSVDQRSAWLRAFFARQLKVEPAAIVTVVVTVSK